MDYDPQWPILYEEEKTHVLGIVGRRALAFEHIGSTAVPDLAAKPIIDMMMGVRGSEEADECADILTTIGYYDVTIPGEDPDWYYCLGKGPHSLGFHLHIVRFGSDHWSNHIVFRDYLRAFREVAKRYEKLKRELAAKYGTDRKEYTKSKTEFIESVIARASKKPWIELSEVE